MRIMILNGPNLNMLGIREPHIYGSTTLDAIKASCEEFAAFAGAELAFHQSNHEGVLVDLIQSARTSADALIINPAAYSFTSIAMFDAMKIFEGPIYEVHISNIHARDELHRHSKLSAAVKGVIAGLGPYGYIVAMQAALQGAGKLPASLPARRAHRTEVRRTRHAGSRLPRHLERSHAAGRNRLGALDHARTCRRARRHQRISGVPHLPCAGRLGEPLLHPLRTRGRTRRRRCGLSGAAERADAVVAAHHAAARQFRARRRPQSRPQPAPARAASSLPCASTPRRRGTPPHLSPSSPASTASSPRGSCSPTSRRPRSRRARRACEANDGSFAALLLIEGLDEAAVRDALHHLRKTLPAEDHGAIDDLPLYRLAFSLPKRLLPG